MTASFTHFIVELFDEVSDNGDVLEQSFTGRNLLLSEDGQTVIIDGKIVAAIPSNKIERIALGIGEI